MRLIHLQNTDNAYVAKAEITLKAFGVVLGKKNKTYIRNYSETNWRENKTNRVVSKNESAHLNKWLHDHQKFVER